MGKANFWADRGKRIIDEEYRVLGGIAEVCCKLGISGSHFRDLFQSSFGMTPKHYLEAVQVEHAKDLLSDGSLKVSQICMMVGFKHRWAFQRAFKKSTGHYPSEYRRIVMNTRRMEKITREI